MARLVPINCGNAKSSVRPSHPKVTHCTTKERERERENKNILYSRERREKRERRVWNT
jgi:hypothetical protein